MTKDDKARERIIALSLLLEAEIHRLDEAFSRFRESTAERFVAGNEFRQALSDVQGLMATRRELEAFATEYRNAHSNLLAALADLRTSVAVGPAELARLAHAEAQASGRREGISNFAAAAVALTTIVISIIAAAAAVLIATHKI